MKKHRPHHTLWLPWTAAVVTASVMLGSWHLLNLRDHAHLEKMTVDAAEAAASLLRRDLESRISALQLLAHHRELPEDAGRESWKADVAAYISELPGYLAIEWADASMQVHRTVYLAGDEPAAGVDIANLPDAIHAAQQAQSTRRIVITPPIGPDTGGDIMMAILPVYQDDQFAGLVIGVFRIIPWLDDVLRQGNTSNYSAGISINGHPVYGFPAEVSFAGSRWLAERALSLYGLDWFIQMAPTTGFVSTVHSQLSTAVMVLGLMLSAFLGWIVHASLHARQQARLLENSASHMTELLKNLPGMAFRFILEKSWPAAFVSEGCKDLCGYSKSQFEQRLVFWGDLIHPDDRSPVWASVREAISRNHEFENEYRIITRVGKEKWVWSCGRRIDAGNGNAVYLEGLITDITSRKRAAAALVDAEAYAKAVVETAAEAVITVDDEGRIETFNQAAQQMFGYTFEEIVGKNVQTLLPEQQDAEKDHYFNRLLTGNSSLEMARGRDATGLRKNGTSLPIRLSVSEVHNHSGRKLVGLIRDLSEQRAAEHEASEHRERLAHLDRLTMLGEMATGIAHEINQPLSAISMYAQSGIRFLNADVLKPERLHDALIKLDQQAHRAGAIIERMQQLGKQHETERETIDGNLVMKQVLALAETEARMRDMEIRLDLCPERRRIVGDPVQIQQVALNLLRNGMEAMESSGRHHGNYIVMRTECGNDGFKVSVIDSGIGVSRKVAEKLYQPFSTTKKSGMGLGLSICRSIIGAHGGQLGFVNNDQGGATFYFVLPYAKRNIDENN